VDAFLSGLGEVDACSAFFLLLVLYVVGETVVGGDHVARARGFYCAGIAFLAYGAYGLHTHGIHYAGDAFVLALRSAIVAGMVLCISWIVLPLISPLLRATTAPARWWQHARDARHARERAHAAQEQAASNARYRRHEEADARDARRRRIDARANAELSFSVFAPKVADRFTREHLSQYLRTYMGDDQPPDDVERRGEQLIRTLQQHVDEAEPPEEKRSLEDLAHWLADQRERIAELPLEDRMKRTLTAELNARYADLSSRLLSEIEP